MGQLSWVRGKRGSTVPANDGVTFTASYSGFAARYEVVTAMKKAYSHAGNHAVAIPEEQIMRRGFLTMQ